MHMDKKELINLIKKVPIENKIILDNDIYIYQLQEGTRKINGIQVITFYKEQLDHNNKIKLINFYLDEFTIRYLNELKFSENLMTHAYYKWLIKHHIFPLNITDNVFNYMYSLFLIASYGWFRLEYSLLTWPVSIW